VRDAAHTRTDGAAERAAAESIVELVDLRSNKRLLVVRRRTEETERSPAAAVYRDQVNGCALALAVRRAVEP
jgi:hypothetical protein